MAIKLGRREKILAVVFGGMALLFLMDNAALSPFLAQLSLLNSKIEAEEKMLARLNYIDSQKEEIGKAFEKIQEYIKIGKTEEETLSVAMKGIEEITKISNVTLLNMKPEISSAKTDKPYKTSKIEIDIEGSQRDIVTFLYKIEDSGYLLTINKLDFRVKDKKSGLMAGDMDVYLLYFL